MTTADPGDYAPNNGARPAALHGLRVVELGEGVAPAFAGRWLAAFGAEVVTVEPPGGHWSRQYSPGGEAWPGDAAPLAAYLLAGKSSVTIDLADAGAGAALRTLLAGADLFIHDYGAPPISSTVGWGDRAYLDAHALAQEQPSLIEVALTPFGGDGPYAGYQASAITLLALGGYQFLTGEPGREPLMLPGFQPEYLSALYGIIAGLAALLRRDRIGRGGAVDIAMQEVLASLHQFTITQYLYQGTIRSRHGNRWENLYPITMLPCRNGYLAFSLPSQDMWERLCPMIGRPELIDEPRFATPMLRREHADEVDAILLDWLKDRDMAPVFKLAQEQWRLPINPYCELAETLADPQYRTRGFWVRAAGDPTGILHPGMPVVMRNSKWQIGSIPNTAPPGPQLWGSLESEQGRTARSGAYSSTAVRTEGVTVLATDGPNLSHTVGSSAPRIGGQGAGSAGDPPAAALPLAGIRVLDFTRVWSGPLCTRVLADLGADVIKVDSPLLIQPATQAGTAATGQAARLPLSVQNKHARNKRSVAIDLRLPAGRELVKRLVTKADVLVENFSARVMPQFGLAYDVLHELNPRLIMLGMPGYGATGPYRDYLGYGPSSEAMTGMTALLGYPGEEPLNCAIGYPDPVAGMMGAAAVTTALVQRRRTGQGQFIDLSQLEPTTMMFGEYFLDFQMTGRRPRRTGNEHPYWTPHGTYRCRDEDEWVSLAVRSDEEWRRFCAVTGLEFPPECATAAGRRERREQIDVAVSAWMRTRDKFDAMHLLQRAGVPAGAVLNAKEMLADPHLAQRGFFIQARAANGETFTMPGTPVRIDGQLREEWSAAPFPGEHNRDVLEELLGLSPREIEALEAEGVLAGDVSRV